MHHFSWQLIYLPSSVWQHPIGLWPMSEVKIFVHHSNWCPGLQVRLIVFYFFALIGAGETRLGLMWTCMTLYNRPYQCFTPELQPEWLLALICIFVGCICITTAIILLASSNWDRDVIPYARWVGFTASKSN